jgi:hypothetical protein
VISLRGESFGVIRRVVRGFEGALIDNPRTDSVSDDRESERECERWGRLG